jgi:hypothetical protein
LLQYGPAWGGPDEHMRNRAASADQLDQLQSTNSPPHITHSACEPNIFLRDWPGTGHLLLLRIGASLLACAWHCHLTSDNCDSSLTGVLTVRQNMAARLSLTLLRRWFSVHMFVALAGCGGARVMQ